MHHHFIKRYIFNQQPAGFLMYWHEGLFKFFKKKNDIEKFTNQIMAITLIIH